MVAKLYNWNDVGAPSLGTSNDGSLFSILRACLVDGYGTRTSAGWTMPYSDLPTKRGIFKPVTSSVHLFLDDNYNYQFARVRGCDSAIDIDTLIGVFPTEDELLGNPANNLLVSKRYSTSTSNNTWHLIADDEWFYFITERDTRTFPGGFFFGKIDHADSNFGKPYLITGILSATDQPSIGNFPYSIFQSANGYWFVQDNYFQIGVADQVDEEGLTRSYVNPNPISGKIEVGKLELHRSTTPYIRHGRRPNLSRSLGLSCVVYFSGDKVVFNAKKYLISRYGTLLFFIEYDVEVG